MNETVLQRMCCPVCRGPLDWHTDRQDRQGKILDGVAWCLSCENWYPLEDGLLELLPPNLGYAEDRRRFWESHGKQLHSLGLRLEGGGTAQASVDAQLVQQKHFDWYASNDQQTYTSYESMPFWEAFDELVFHDWHPQMKTGGWLLDVGCAQGRSTFKVVNLPLHIVAFDVSKALVRQALTQYRKKPYAADATFFVGDASCLPFQLSTFDYVLIYGVLHHLPDPEETCREVARVLKPGGIYFGAENNTSVMRKVFDWLMKINPLWHEEAGSHPLISARQMQQWFGGSPVKLQCDTRIFVPPHLVNLLGKRCGRWLLRASERIGRCLPFVRNNGGLIMIRGEHCGSRPVRRAPSPALAHSA